MATTALSVEALRAHVGRTQVSTDMILPGPANMLRLALYFLPRVPTAELRADGSPRDTGVVPPMELPRRMFAGERVRFQRPLRIGEAVRRETQLADISMKSGSTGTLVFATVTSRVVGADGGVALEDERRTVFREEVNAGERNQAPKREPAPADVAWRTRVTPDPVLLFRYSALTFNSHRIHYDRAWAMEVEGYPGLVVHGPLTTTLLVDFARDQNPGRRVVGYATQARAPLFDTAPFELRGRPSACGCECWAVTPEGTVAMSCEVELA